MSIYERLKSQARTLRLDTKLDMTRGVRGGEELSGTVYLYGGQEPSHITVIEFHLVAEFLSDPAKQPAKERGVIYRHAMNTSVKVGPGEELRIPFRFPIPYSTPVSMETSRVWLETAVNVRMEKVRNDRDEVRVLPHPVVQDFFEAVKLLGLKLDEVTLLHVPHLGLEFPYVQEYEYKPRLPSTLDEIEFYFTSIGKDRVELCIEIDRRLNGFSGLLEKALDLDERNVRLTLTREGAGTPEQLADALAQIIVTQLKS